MRCKVNPGIVKALTKALGLLVVICPLAARATLNEIPTTSTWVTNGPVNAIAATSSTIYLGGNFTYVGPANRSYFVPISASTGQAIDPHPQVNGPVYASAPDGSGGTFIGGSFSQVGKLARQNIAHIKADGQVDPAWNPGVDGTVYALLVSGGTVYVGGSFTTIGGQARNCLAAMDAASGAVKTWNPGANSSVNDILISGSTLFVRGWFTSIGGQARNNLAAVDTASGAVKAWNPNPDSSVSAMTLSGSTVYIGGRFSHIGGQARNYLAAVDTANGLSTAWNPNPGAEVGALAVSGGTVYVGGNFGTIGGQTRHYLAALDLASGVATAWNPSPDDRVDDLAVAGGIVYASGVFSTIGGQTRNYLAAVDAATGAATAWNPNPDNQVSSLVASGGTIYAGGSFKGMGGQACLNLAALDAATGKAMAWNPQADGPDRGLPMVQALAVAGGKVYVGGSFDTMGGQPRIHLACLDATSGAVTTWNPSSSNSVNALAVSGQTVYVGGVCGLIGGQGSTGIAALDATSGKPISTWKTLANGDVLALAVSGSTVYACGPFSFIGGKMHVSPVALDAVTGAVKDWDPFQNTFNQSSTLAVAGGTVYVGGAFSNVGGLVRNNLVAVDAATGNVTAWNPNPNGAVSVLTASGGTVYVRGSFTTIGGQARNGFAALDKTTGMATAWNPQHDGGIRAIQPSGTTVYVGGSFTQIGGEQQLDFAQFDTDPPAAPAQPHATLLDPTSIRWEWDDASNNEDGFKVWADAGTAAPTTLRTTSAAGATSWTMTGLAANTQYAFQVAATNAAGDSARSTLYTTWTLIQPVGALTFPSVTATSIAVAPSGTYSNLTAGLAGIFLANDTAGSSNNWQQSSAAWVSSPLTPNTLYSFRGRSRNGARISGTGATATQWTLAPPPIVGANVTCDQTTGATHLLGTTFTFNNPAGFGASAHGGNAYKVSAYRWKWDTTPASVLTAGDDQWNASSMAFTPDVSGIYYLHLAALNAVGTVQPTVLHYGPFLALAPGRLTAAPASLSYLEGGPFAVDVEKGGAPTQKTLTLTNPGAIAVTFTVGNVATPGLRLTGPAAADYQIAAVSPSTATPLAPGGSLTVTIRFAPTEARRTLGLMATLEITCDSPVTPFMMIPLTGDAVPVEMSNFKVE